MDRHYRGIKSYVLTGKSPFEFGYSVRVRVIEGSWISLHTRSDASSPSSIQSDIALGLMQVGNDHGKVNDKADITTAGKWGFILEGNNTACTPWFV